MKAVAKKKDQTRAEAIADFQAMGILRCDACGDDFVIYHSPAFVSKSVADRQAYWLEKVVAEEHERDKKHPTGSNCQNDPHGRKAEGSKWLTKLFDVHIAR
jgi:hypothetical protein